MIILIDNANREQQPLKYASIFQSQNPVGTMPTLMVAEHEARCATLNQSSVAVDARGRPFWFKMANSMYHRNNDMSLNTPFPPRNPWPPSLDAVFRNLPVRSRPIYHIPISIVVVISWIPHCGCTSFLSLGRLLSVNQYTSTAGPHVCFDPSEWSCNWLFLAIPGCSWPLALTSYLSCLPRHNKPAVILQ